MVANIAVEMTKDPSNDDMVEVPIEDTEDRSHLNLDAPVDGADVEGADSILLDADRRPHPASHEMSMLLHGHRRRPGGGKLGTTRWSKERFIQLLTSAPNITQVCKMMHITRRSAYQAKQKDPEFARKWDAAMSDAPELLRDSMMTRAIYGSAKPVHWDKDPDTGKTVPVAYERVWDTRLQQIMAEATMPNEFDPRVRQARIMGSAGDSPETLVALLQMVQAGVMRSVGVHEPDDDADQTTDNAQGTKALIDMHDDGLG